MLKLKPFLVILSVVALAWPVRWQLVNQASNCFKPCSITEEQTLFFQDVNGCCEIIESQKEDICVDCQSDLQPSRNIAPHQIKLPIETSFNSINTFCLYKKSSPHFQTDAFFISNLNKNHQLYYPRPCPYLFAIHTTLLII